MKNCEKAVNYIELLGGIVVTKSIQKTSSGSIVRCYATQSRCSKISLRTSVLKSK